ncbi:hypothetical protein [Dyella japonica]|uniref:hypothetical protein n=1 Tax=Dyella japonica TaxID=231455 RepID=UPI0002D305C5|nr:hypothetical protein [Dyella japonica]
MPALQRRMILPAVVAITAVVPALVFAVPYIFTAMGSRGSGLCRLPKVAWLQHPLPNAHAAFRGNARAMKASLCVRVRGVAVLPRALGDAAGSLHRIDPGEAPPVRDMWLGYRRDMRRLTRRHALLEAVVQQLAHGWRVR